MEERERFLLDESRWMRGTGGGDFMTEQMSVRDWETLRGTSRRTVNPWGDCPMT